MRFRDIEEEILDYSKTSIPVKYMASMNNFEEHIRELNKTQTALVCDISQEDAEFFRDYCWWFYKLLKKADNKPKWYEFWRWFE